jgi:hypothetical protein
MTTEQALRGDGGRELQRVVRAHVEQRQRQGGYEISAVTRGISVHPQVLPAPQPRATHKPSTDNPNAWMSADLQKFYKHQERKQKLDKVLEENEKFATANPNSVLARKLHLDRQLALDKMYLAQLDAWAARDALKAKVARKDPWAAYRLL